MVRVNTLMDCMEEIPGMTSTVYVIMKEVLGNDIVIMKVLADI